MLVLLQVWNTESGLWCACDSWKVLAPILAVGVDVDATNESAVSGVLKVTPTFGLFLLSTFSNFGIVGTKISYTSHNSWKAALEEGYKFKKPIHEYQLLNVKKLDLNLRCQKIMF